MGCFWPKAFFGVTFEGLEAVVDALLEVYNFFAVARSVECKCQLHMAGRFDALHAFIPGPIRLLLIPPICSCTFTWQVPVSGVYARIAFVREVQKGSQNHAAYD